MAKHTEEARLDFEGQRPDEELLFVFRRHIIAMRKGFYLLLIPFALSSLPVRSEERRVGKECPV